ncbi:hypothetical protein ACFL2Q_11490 [Thermodesulfobacteriota bacterium]
MGEGYSDWSRKGSTLSDKSARKEFGLTQEEVIQAINDGKLQYRENSIRGNPFLRLLRHEVEALVEERHGSDYLKRKRFTKELSEVNRDIKRLKAEIASLETRKKELQEMLGE